MPKCTKCGEDYTVTRFENTWICPKCMKPKKEITCCGECPICHKTVLCYCEIDGHVTSLKTPACDFVHEKHYLKFKDYMEEE